MEEIQFCKGGGCTAKLGPAVLDRVLSKLKRREDPNLIIGFDSKDDAAVYRIADDIAVVQTLDFFPPMLDDPYIFGQIAAANAMSDVWAMGGQVRTALNIVCFPEKMDLNILGKIIQGGNDKVLEAGASLVGGHSIADDSVKYGLSVTGTIDPKKIFPNNGVQEGDVLLLTKPLGVGIVCTANRIGKASEGAMRRAVRSMTSLNRKPSEILQKLNVHGCTDVTGFGLLVHLTEMLENRFSADVDSKNVPVIDEALVYADDFLITAAGERNRKYAEKDISFSESVSFAMQEVLFDPQTSGGLLVSLPEEDAAQAFAEIGALGLPCFRIGRVTEKREKKIYVQ